MRRTSGLSRERVAIIKALPTRGLRQVDIVGQVNCSHTAVSKCLKNDSSRKAICGRNSSRWQKIGSTCTTGAVFQNITCEWNNIEITVFERTTRRRLVK